MNIRIKKTLTCSAIIAALTLASSAAYAVTVTSSTNDGNGPENTIDNNLDTRWSANGDGEYLQYDLGESLNIDSLNIAFYKGDQRSASFEVHTSEDGTDWKTVFSGTQDTSTTDQFNVALEESVGQFVKVVGYGNTSNSWNSITEVDINTSVIDTGNEDDDNDGVINSEDDCANTPAGIEVDQNGCKINSDNTEIVYSATSSTDDGNVADNVLDEDYNSRWSANGNEEWLQLGLGSLQTIETLNIAFFKGSSRTSTFDILVSANGENWSTALSDVTSSGESTELEIFDLDGVEAQYIRYVGYGNSSNSWNSVTEMNVTIANTPIDCDVTPEAEECEPPVDCDVTPEADECIEDELVWDWSLWDLEGGDNDLDPVVGNTMVFDALAAQHVTSNGNGWRHELKIKSSERVAMTEVYEDFKANIKLDISDGSKMIVIQHHAEDTGTIMKLYVADSDESDIGDSVPGDGVFGVYVRLRNESGSEEKMALGSIVSGDNFDFHVINDYGHVTVTAMGETFSLTIDDSDNSYLKFGNYLQAQYTNGDKVDDSDDWAAFYQDTGITESKLTFSNLSYERLYEGGGNVSTDDDNDSVANDDDNCPNTPAGTTVDANGCEVVDNGNLDDDNDGVVNDDDNCPNTPSGTNVDAYGCAVIVDDCTVDDSCPVQGGDFVRTGILRTTSPGDLADTLKEANAGDEIVVTGGADEISIKDLKFDTPVLVRADSIGSTTLTSVSLTNSNNIFFSGFVFGPNSDASTLFKIVSSTNIRVLRSVFDHKDVEIGQNSIIMSGSSQFIEIAYNTFRDKNVTHREGGKNTGSFIKYQYESEDGLMTSDTHVHHNYFKNIPAYVATGNTTPEGDSDREAIVMGIADSQDKVTNNLVEYNLFENCDGENEIITVKTSGNEFSNNTFVNSMGSLSFRLGHSNVAHSNQFYGSGDSAVWTDENYQTGGIRVYGEGHEIYNNYMEGLTGESWRLPLLLDNGDTADTLGNDSHQTPSNVLVANNTIVNSNGGVHIGRASNTKYKNAPHNNTITNNTVVGSQGILFENDAEQSTNAWSGNDVYATGSSVANGGGALNSSELNVLSNEPSINAPTPLTSSDVGPTAP